MEQRFKTRKKQILEDAEIKPQVYEGVSERLAEFLDPFGAALGRREQKEHMRAYLEGLLSDLERKNAEGIAYLHDQDRRAMQHFVGESHWGYEPLLEELSRQVGTDLGEADGVLAFDPSGFEKDGRDSVGVQRQWLGRLGKVDNGQVGVYLGYSTRKGHALCDVRLYLPKEWAKDRVRRRKCGVPPSVRFRTKHELAQEMLLSRRALLPHLWITGDDEMGRSTRFRGWLRTQGEQYLLAVPSTTTIRDLEAEPPTWSGHGRKPKTKFGSVTRWSQALPESAWTTIDVRDGEKGPLTVQIVKCRVQARTEKHRVGPEELLVVTRVQETKGWKVDYYLSNAPASTPLQELARVGKAHHRIEECFKNGKSEAGLADYEVRTWIGWHHHQVLSLLASWFLIRETQRGKKIHPRADGIADTRTDHVVAA